MLHIRKPDWKQIRSALLIAFLLFASVRGVLLRYGSPSVPVPLHHSVPQPLSGAPEQGAEEGTADHDAPEARDGTKEDAGGKQAEESESGRASGKININAAGPNELVALNGIGPAKAKAIVEYREAYGQFRALEELMEVKGIGFATFEKIKQDICL